MRLEGGSMQVSKEVLKGHIDTIILVLFTNMTAMAMK